MAEPKYAYDRLVATLKEISLLGSIGALLEWDEQTHLPEKGFEHRANQSSMLAKMRHDWFTSAVIDDSICWRRSRALR